MDGIDSIIKHIVCPSGITVESYQDMATQPPSIHSEIVTYTRKLIIDYPTHVITGGYTIGNLQNRPTNTFILVKNNQQLELILNYNPNWEQIIVYGTPTEKSRKWLRHLFLRLSGAFIFCSGKELREIGLSSYSHEKSLKNTVYLLDPHFRSNSSIPENVYIIDGDQSPTLMKEVTDFYEYKDEDLSKTFRERPHVILKVDNEIVAGARCNEYSPQIAIIGGVMTLINHRKRGYGTITCRVLISFLVKRCELVALETDESNFPAMKIYEKIGFKKIGTSIFLDDKTGIIDRIIGDRNY
ncbi:MAG: GNAT family N-acetyltransferase [Candidatus Kariarchaeaceae archaeon]|jgi:RimJ/RimL family protein N-acetyltransferase